MGLFSGLDTQTDLSLVKGTLSTAQPAISRLHDSFFQKIHSEDLVMLMVLDTFILPWLIYYYQTAQSECKQFKKNQLLAPFFKKIQFNLQISVFERWLAQSLQHIQHRQEQVTQQLQAMSVKKKLPTAQQSSSDKCWLQTLSDRQWSDWSSRATGKNQGLYDASVCVTMQSSEQLSVLEPCLPTITETEFLTAEAPSDEAEKKEKMGWGWRLLWSSLRWIKKELALISGVALITSLAFSCIFSPSWILIAVCITSLVGVTISTLRPLWRAMIRWWRTDAEKVAQYYQFTEDFWSQSVDRFQQSTLDLKQLGLEFYRFELPHVMYEALCESGQQIVDAFSQRKPEHRWKANPIHQQHRLHGAKRIQEKLQTLQRNFQTFHCALAGTLYQQFKQAVVKRNAVGLVLHVDDRVLYTIHRLYAFLGMSDQVTIERWSKDFFAESMESYLEVTQQSSLGFPLKKIKNSIKERLSLQYALLCRYWQIPADAHMPFCMRVMIDETAMPDHLSEQEIPAGILEKFKIFCSHTFAGEYWKIRYLTEDFSKQLQDELTKKLIQMGVAETDLETLNCTTDQMQVIHALMKKGIDGENLVEYFNLLNQAWQIYCILSMRKAQMSSTEYLEKKQCLESLLENWLLSLERDKRSIESNMIQVLLLARFDLTHSRRETYQSSSREQVLHQIWWYLVRNWLSSYFNQETAARNEPESIEVDLIKRYYQMTKKIDVENCESWLIAQLSHQDTPQKRLTWLEQNGQLITRLNMPRFTQFAIHTQQVSICALQEVPHAITPNKKRIKSKLLSLLFG